MAKLQGLDGLRAIAVFLVVLTHAELLGCGWVGVQIFFVLSGYLISRQLVEQRDAPLGAYLKWFYGRRALRIFPLYFAVLCGVQALAWAGKTTSGVREGLPYAWVYAYNLYHVSDGFMYSQLLSHFWSLCVEEQVYLVWPLILFFCPPHHLRALLSALVLSGPALRLGAWALFRAYPATFYDPPEMAVYVLTSSHLDAFALGALTALYPPQHSPRKLALAAAAVVAGAALVAAFGGPPSYEKVADLGLSIGLAPGYGFVWMYSLINLFSAFLIDGLARHGLAQRVFESRALRYTGKISYGIYVLHFPLQAFVRKALPPQTYGAALAVPVHLLLTFGLASLSYYRFEAPLLKLKARWFPTPAPSRTSEPALDLVPGTALSESMYRRICVGRGAAVRLARRRGCARCS